MDKWFSAIVPLRVDALSAGNGLPISPAFQNQDAAASRTAPFASSEGLFRPGMHLHWAMPERLTRGQTEKPAKLTAFVHANGLYFPCLPNRWWIGRKIKTDQRHGLRKQGKAVPNYGGYDAIWIVESDVSPNAANERREISTSGNLRLPAGRVVDPLSSPFKHDRSTQRKLSAVGISGKRDQDHVAFPDPHFAAFYPSCHSIFGFFDESYDHSRRQPADYTVIGWYSDPKQDPVSEWARAAFSDPAIAEAYLERHDLAPEGQSDSIGMANALRFSRVTGWDAPSSLGRLPKNLVCYGEVSIKGGTTATPRQSIGMDVTIGSSPSEAAAALMTAGDRATENDLFGIISHREMAPHRLDPLSKLRDLRHSSSFTAQDTHVLWSLAAGDEVTGQTAPEQIGETYLPPPDLPPHLANCLDALNRAETQRAALVDQKRSLQQQLYECWLKSRDTSAGEVDKIERQLNEQTQVIEQLAEQIDAANAVQTTAYDAAQDCLKTCNEMGHVKDRLKLVQSQGPRYWRPSDPVLALKETSQTGALISGARHLYADDQDQKQPCLCRNFDPSWWYHGDQVWHSDRGKAKNQVYSLLNDLGANSVQVARFRQAAKCRDSGAPWNPVAFEWAVNFQCPKSMRQPNGGPLAAYRRDAVTCSFQVPPGFAEFANADRTLYADANLETPPLSLVGRAFMHQSGEEDLAEALRGYLSRIDALLEARGGEDAAGQVDGLLEALTQQKSRFSDVLAELDQRRNIGSHGRITTVPLGGFMEMMLGRAALPPSFVGGDLDPSTMEKVTQCLADAPTLLTPVSGMSAHPLATGTLTVSKGQIIDSFGQALAWGEQHIKVKPAETLSNPEGDRIVLPPRLVEAARLDFRWLSGGDDRVESNAHPLTSPLCGWLVPSHQDCWVLVYDAAGLLLGYVDERRKWQPAPGAPAAPPGPAAFANPHLGDVVGWLISRRGDVNAPESTEMLIADLDALTGAIEPEHAHENASMAMLLGRPLAVARAFVGISGKHSATEETGLRDVTIPVRLGDKTRNNDGLVGFFTPLTLVGDASPSAGTVALRAPSHFSEVTDEAPTLELHVSGQGQLLTLLLDPRCPVHARCGLLPTKSIHIPVSHFAKSLSEIEMVFSVAPVLMAPEGTAIAHPHEPGRKAAWITRRNGNWQQVDHQPIVRRTEFLQAFNGQSPNGESLWSELRLRRWIELLPQDTARLLPADQREKLEAFPDDEMAQLLSKLSKVLRQPEHHAVFGPRAVMQEGWMKLGLGKR